MTLINEQSFAHIVIGVADMQPVRDLWIGHFGMEVVAAQEGADLELAGVWGLDPQQVAEQLLLRTPGTCSGWLHFVRFERPAPPVRLNAAPYDLCPKNIDVNCIDMPARRDELLAGGLNFRSAISEYEIGGITVREVQMPVHDCINTVLIEVFDYPLALSAKHYGAVTSFVLGVPDVTAESVFYREALGLDTVLEHRVAGAAIEKVIGLPPGAALLLRLMGNPDQPYGRAELIEYEGMPGKDLYPQARPPALGSLLGRFETSDLDALVSHLGCCGIHVVELPVASLIFGRCRLAAFKSPAGFSLEAFQRCS
jgi:catechol 2,3-dioxygenase-like lactoylglutathione lyase family enzyme